MGAAAVRRIDAPDGPPVSLAAILGTFLHGLMVVGVMFTLRQHEKIFMCASGSILHAFGHRVWFVPDDVTAEEPATVLQCKSEAPRDAE